jgi:hypothetical protein
MQGAVDESAAPIVNTSDGAPGGAAASREAALTTTNAPIGAPSSPRAFEGCMPVPRARNVQRVRARVPHFQTPFSGTKPMSRTASVTSAPDEDPKARELRLRGRILDAVEQTLDEMARSDALRAAAERAALGHYAALLCTHALCRRAKRCRRQPCVAFAQSQSSSPANAGDPVSQSAGLPSAPARRTGYPLSRV